jgi:signal transduction histidine kinase
MGALKIQRTVDKSAAVAERTGSTSVVLLTPTGRDAEIATQVFQRDTIQSITCTTMHELAEVVRLGAGILVIAEEALTPRAQDTLLDALDAQPSWSDIPIIILTDESALSESAPRALSSIASRANVTLLERPVRIATLMTIVRSALHARQRQFDVRDHLEDLRKTGQSLLEARRQADHANAAKSQFLATMSHELRTPLNAIAGYTELLTLGLRGPVTPEQRKDLERIERSQQHLLSLINDVLNFAKIEAGQVTIEQIPIELSSVFDGLDAFVQPQLQSKRLNYSSPCYEHAVIIGDAEKIRQILLNLLSNAIKFTPDGGHIDILCNLRPNTVEICVRDDGDGIPREKHEAIFEPFVQVGRDFHAPREGTGLGLSISRDLARRMDGDLRVQSNVARGSTFILTLPRGQNRTTKSAREQATGNT